MYSEYMRENMRPEKKKSQNPGTAYLKAQFWLLSN